MEAGTILESPWVKGTQGRGQPPQWGCLELPLSLNSASWSAQQQPKSGPHLNHPPPQVALPECPLPIPCPTPCCLPPHTHRTAMCFTACLQECLASASSLCWLNGRAFGTAPLIKLSKRSFALSLPKQVPCIRNACKACFNLYCMLQCQQLHFFPASFLLKALVLTLHSPIFSRGLPFIRALLVQPPPPPPNPQGCLSTTAHTSYQPFHPKYTHLYCRE